MSPRGGKRLGAGRKPLGDRAGEHLHIRISAERRQAYWEAATRAGMTVSEWVQWHLDVAAGKGEREMSDQYYPDEVERLNGVVTDLVAVRDALRSDKASLAAKVSELRRFIDQHRHVGGCDCGYCLDALDILERR